MPLKLYKVLFTIPRVCSECKKKIAVWEYAYISFEKPKEKPYCNECAARLEVSK